MTRQPQRWSLQGFRWEASPLVALLLIGFLKAFFALVIFYLPGKVHEPWNLYGVKMPTDWLYLFAAWDSGFYHAIATDGYPSVLNALWAYFPLYPACIRLVGLLGLNLWLAAFLVVEVAGFSSILVFQKIASTYLDKAEVTFATILYFLLPPVFVFTTVSYSESLFLLLSLLTWYSHIKKKEAFSAIFASLTVLTRAYGLLILVPLGYDFLHSKQFKNLRLLLYPLVAFVAWLLYGFSKTGNFLAPFSAQSYWNSAVVNQIRDSVSRFILHGDSGMFNFLFQFQLLIAFSILFLVVITFLCIRTWNLDRSLGVYSCTFLLGIGFLAVALIQTFVSLPRFLSLIFPAGISLRSKRRWMLRVMLGLFASLDLIAWWMFLFTNSFH
ncbi:MAG: mannosyltransferase family protein [Candidatus Bathyarchaeia archaeon]